MTTDPVSLVLRELAWAWHPSGPTGFAASIDTFDPVNQKPGEHTWDERSVDGQAELLCAWLRRTANYLRDRDGGKPLWRYRVAAAVAPRLILGRNFDEANLLRVARAIERDLSFVERLRRGLSRRSAKRAQARLRVVVERYQYPPESPNRWAYVLAAVDLAARFLPYYRSLMRNAGMPCRESSSRRCRSQRRRRVARCRATALRSEEFAWTCPERPRRRQSFRRACVAMPGSCGNGDNEFDVAPFVVVVADAYCPGLGRTLDIDSIRKAVAAWRDLDQSKRTVRGVKVERRPRYGPAWKIVKSLTGRKGSIANTARRWRELMPTILPAPLVVINGLVNMVQVPGHNRFVTVPRGEAPITTFVPRDGPGAMWVKSLIIAVHGAMPTKSTRRTSTGAAPHANGARRAAQRSASRAIGAQHREGPKLPEAFLVEAEGVLPSVPRGERGPQPMSNREALPWIIHKFRSGCGWNELPNSTTYHRRYQKWRAAGLERLRALVAKHFILSPQRLMSLS